MPRSICKITLSMALLLIISTWATVTPGQSSGTSQGDKSVGQRYASLISYDVNATKWFPGGVEPPAEASKKMRSTIKITPVLDLDKVPGAFYMDFNWMGKGSSEDYLDDEENFNDFDEVIGLIGSKGEKDVHGLGGEVEIWLGGEKYLITKSCLIFVPKGLKHCPLRFNRVDAPILFFSVGMTDTYSSIPSSFNDNGQ